MVEGPVLSLADSDGRVPQIKGRGDAQHLDRTAEGPARSRRAVRPAGAFSSL